MSDTVSGLRVVGVVENPPEIWERWRLCQPYWRLSQLGYDVRLAALDRNNGMMVRRGEVVVLPRMTVNPQKGRKAAQQWLKDLRRQASAIVYECDDDLFTDGFDEHLISSRFQQGLTVNQIRQQRLDNQWFLGQVDGVTVSTEPLAAIVRQYTDKPVIVVPNALDVRWFRAMLPPRPSWREDGIVTIGWAGGRRPERDLEQMAEAWGRIARRYPHVRFVIAAPGKPSFLFRAIDDDSRIVWLEWLDWERYPGAMQVDIGCCAVADTPFSRAKTPIKAWEYAAAGAAVVATPTLYGECVKYRGDEAASVDEWENALADLVTDGTARYKNNQRLLSHVEYDHALDVQARRWLEAYEQILAARPSKAAQS